MTRFLEIEDIGLIDLDMSEEKMALSAISLTTFDTTFEMMSNDVDSKINRLKGDVVMQIPFDANPAKIIAIIPSGGSTATFISGTVILELE